MPRYDLVCLGCGPAGETAATTAATLGRRVAVVEREGRPGGNMVNTGTIASKVLRETALLCSAFRRRPLPGVDPAVDRTLSVAQFMSRRHLAQIEEHDRIEQVFDRLGIEVVHGTGRIAGRNAVEVATGAGSRVLESDHILIATGSRPVRPSHVEFDDHFVFDADGILELDRIPSSMAVVGGGVIGTEYACIFAEIGVAVTLLEPRDTVLPFLDPECREILLQSMRDTGIRIRTMSPVQAVRPTTQGAEIALESGGWLAADTVLWAQGRTGNTENLGLESVGLSPDRRGLLGVDDLYRTKVPSILAVGDVIGFPALASTSIEQGRIAALRLFGGTTHEGVAQTVPLGIYTIPAVAAVGLLEEDAVKSGRNVVVGRASYRRNVRGRMLGDDTGLAKLVFDGDTQVLLGATIVGEDATELVHLAQMAIVAGLGIDYFVSACMNYPSLTDLYKLAARDALRQIDRRSNTSGAERAA
ncbi:MAG: Si-specific NAD(P)(+) transhydrogenase [Phycisphaerales bacterium]|nr:Si-specific NAD(P)(+) transhydrogenase [Phycisphaerales bacterium]